MDQTADQRDATARNRQAAVLREEGKEFLRAGRWREAQSRFQQVLEMVPDDPVTKDFLDLAKEHQRVPRAQPARPPVAVATPVPALVGPVGDARLELYFNCPISVGRLTIDLDGQSLAERGFDFRVKGILGIKKKGSGIIEDAFKVKAGDHSVVVRLKDSGGALLGEQTLRAGLEGGGRYVLKIEMDGEQSVPRFSLTAVRGR